MNKGRTNTCQKGVACPNPRFVEGAGKSSNCVTDKLTGLTWIKNPDAIQRRWALATRYCEGLDGADGRGGYQDWRLPSKRELLSLIDDSMFNPALPPGHPFAGVQSDSMWSDGYWSSTAYAGDTVSAWHVDLTNGYLHYALKTTTSFVWPVRGGPATI